MMRGASILLLALGAATAARANTFVVTNNIEALTNATMSVDKQAAVRGVINARLGDWSLPLALSGHSIVWEWRDPRVDLLVHTWAGTVLDGAAGRVAVTAAMDRVQVGEYSAEAWAIINGIRAHRLAINTIQVTNSAPQLITYNISNSIPIVVTANVAGVEIVLTNYFSLSVDPTILVSNAIANFFSPNFTNTTIIQLDNITSEVTFYVTGAVVSVNGATGTVVLGVAAATNQVGYAEWDGTVLRIGTKSAGLGGSGALAFIGSYTYTGGEASVTFDFDPVVYALVTLDGDLVAVPGTNAQAGSGAVLGVRINGHLNGHRANMRYDSVADSIPASVDQGTFNSITNTMRLIYLPQTNDNYLAYARSFIAGEWSFVSSARGVSARGSGHGFYASYFNHSFEMIGSLRNDDFANRNVITQMLFQIINQTNGAVFAAASNATIRLWGIAP